MLIEAQSLKPIAIGSKVINKEIDCIAMAIWREFGQDVYIVGIRTDLPTLEVLCSVYGLAKQLHPHIRLHRSNRIANWYAYLYGLDTAKPTTSPYFSRPLDALKWLYVARRV